MVSNIFILTVAIFCFSGVHIAETVNWSDCGSVTGSLVNVTVKDCDDTRCPLIRGQNGSLSITFTPKVVSNKIVAVVYGEVFGIKKKFDLPAVHSCEEVGFSCPVQPDQTYVYTNTIYVKPSYPKVTVNIYWELQDDEGKDLACAVIPAKIVAAI